jgi:hypothetical protein
VKRSQLFIRPANEPFSIAAMRIRIAPESFLIAGQWMIRP